MEKLFTYGTLQDPFIQQRVFGRVATMQHDTLEGFKKGIITLSGSTYFIAIREQGAKMSGKVLEATPEEMILLDEYETSAYTRIKVTLKSGITAWVYCRP
jgi:gamma-glutamylcyclotransferase (GGCT)/AIG2-like uncharacterized protein YtfP